VNIDNGWNNPAICKFKTLSVDILLDIQYGPCCWWKEAKEEVV